MRNDDLMSGHMSQTFSFCLKTRRNQQTVILLDLTTGHVSQTFTFLKQSFLFVFVLYYLMDSFIKEQF
jgi:hypothetical protein